MATSTNSLLFNSTLNGNNTWGELFQSISTFKPLIETIFVKHGYEINEIKNLTPGTNAVFKIDDKVIKIFAPIESGFNTNNDYYTEIAALKHANDRGITAPLLLHTGSIEDRYLFRYIIMDFINGVDAEHKLFSYPNSSKCSFARKLRSITNRLNTKVTQNVIPFFDLNGCLDNLKWNEFSNTFCQDRKTFIKSKSFTDFVYTHGDLTAENMIIDEKDEIYIIDFADSHIAPFYYEWPPIVFALFGCDPLMMESYFGDIPTDEFYDTLTLSMVTHEFGSNILKQICDITKVSIHNIRDIRCLKALLIECIKIGQVKVR